MIIISSSRFHVIYGEEELTEETSSLHFGSWEWYHQCTALNTVTGRILIVINGKVFKDDIEPHLVDSSSSRPTSLKGTLG